MKLEIDNYIIYQSHFTYHVLITYNDKLVFHLNCDMLFTENELREILFDFINIYERKEKEKIW